MPKIESWDNLPAAVWQHLIEEMRDRAISIADLNQLRLWIESKPDVPESDWHKDFGSFKDLRPRIASENVPASRTSSPGRSRLTGFLPVCHSEGIVRPSTCCGN